jgi:8-oxo-dGTP pyrophosphatase MutT (NUDIX family)
MKFWYKIAYILSPFAIWAFRIYTRITGQERARLLVFNERGELLLLRSAIGHGQRWSMPGGGINRGETPVRGAARELFEETGIKIDPEQLTPVAVLRHPEVATTFVMHLYTVTVHTADLPSKLHNPLEIIETAWFALEHLPERRSPYIAPALAKLSNNKRI